MLVWLCCGLAAGAEDRPGIVLVPWAAQNISDHCWVNAAGAAENSFKPLTTIVRPGKGWGRCLDPFGAGLGVLHPWAPPTQHQAPQLLGFLAGAGARTQSSLTRHRTQKARAF